MSPVQGAGRVTRTEVSGPQAQLSGSAVAGRFGLFAGDEFQRPTTGSNELVSMLKRRADATEGFSPSQLSEYSEQMLAAVKDAAPRIRSKADKLAIAGAIPGAFGAMQPSGATLNEATESSSLSATREMQEMNMSIMDMRHSMLRQSQLSQALSHYTALSDYIFARAQSGAKG